MNRWHPKISHCPSLTIGSPGLISGLACWTWNGPAEQLFSEKKTLVFDLTESGFIAYICIKLMVNKKIQKAVLFQNGWLCLVVKQNTKGKGLRLIQQSPCLAICFTNLNGRWHQNLSKEADGIIASGVAYLGLGQMGDNIVFSKDDDSLEARADGIRGRMDDSKAFADLLQPGDRIAVQLEPWAKGSLTYLDVNPSFHLLCKIFLWLLAPGCFILPQNVMIEDDDSMTMKFQYMVFAHLKRLEKFSHPAPGVLLYKSPVELSTWAVLAPNTPCPEPNHSFVIVHPSWAAMAAAQIQNTLKDNVFDHVRRDVLSNNTINHIYPTAAGAAAVDQKIADYGDGAVEPIEAKSVMEEELDSCLDEDQLGLDGLQVGQLVTVVVAADRQLGPLVAAELLLVSPAVAALRLALLAAGPELLDSHSVAVLLEHLGCS
ncbi:hypothetical protein C8J56DRAFT_893412 [Mycena floridula]|nr:hypothetical protein C8J56DRAFT_893412 [Mycena floridula]